MSTAARRLLTLALVGVTLATGAPPAFADDSHADEDLVLRGPSAGVSQVTLAQAVTAVPRPAVSLPAALDARPTYQAGVSCDPVDRPGSTRLGRLLVDTYGTGYFGVSRYCNGSTSEHHEGRAVDWMLDAANPAHAAVADAFLTQLVAADGAMARRLGIQYVIWNRKTWRAYAPERGWTPYTGASPHTDHIHISLTWDGAMARTSWWTGRAVTTRDVGTCRVYAGQPAPLYTGVRTKSCAGGLPAAPPSTLPVVAIGSRDATNVKRGQSALGITADGVFGSGTQRAVLAYQRSSGLPQTGAFDKATWNRLVPSAVTAPPVTSPGPTTPAPTTPSTTTRPPVASPPRTSRPTTTLRVPAAVVRPLAAHKRTVLRAGATGTAVRSLQSTLGVRVTGRHDAATVAAVKRVQARWKLPQTGVVDLRTWNRVELTRYPWLGYTGTTLRSGSKGPGVVALQRALKVGADGQFGPRTAQAVRGVQARYGLPATGVVDAATWRAISHAAR
ncbi:peptidoglycan-binding domain-containing protein [Mobilicoccus caccae]|uniref:Peptidoglycan hydrolase-like protein with peptidoglycan-binding domain n=1 Tax=Mobilicoccus caccae TaxID=1859295 RepID=A0ABQ6IQF7_9MICO|nr:peptidoglycan-binding domain-containing protein [Mobilicoccus caccae]GMA38962.1 hypothetical protein GCM10025883_10070 [Mobilicoccus caccae]